MVVENEGPKGLLRGGLWVFSQIKAERIGRCDVK